MVILLIGEERESCYGEERERVCEEDRVNNKNK